MHIIMTGIKVPGIFSCFLSEWTIKGPRTDFLHIAKYKKKHGLIHVRKKVGKRKGQALEVQVVDALHLCYVKVMLAVKLTFF